MLEFKNNVKTWNCDVLIIQLTFKLLHIFTQKRLLLLFIKTINNVTSCLPHFQLFLHRACSNVGEEFWVCVCDRGTVSTRCWRIALHSCPKRLEHVGAVHDKWQQLEGTRRKTLKTKPVGFMEEDC